MAFYHGEEFVLQRYDTCRKDPAGFCESVGCESPTIMKGDRVAVVAWGPGDKWTLMHPDCAERSEQNLANQKAKLESQIDDEPKSFGESVGTDFNKYGCGTRNDMIAALHANRLLRGITFDPTAKQNSRYKWVVG